MNTMVLKRSGSLFIVSVLALLAIGPVSAYGVEFQIEGKPALLATATGEQEGKGKLSVPARNFTLTCVTGDIEVGEIINSARGLATVKPLECTALNLKTGAELPCIVEGPALTGVILPKEHGGKKYVLIEPEGETFGIKFLTGELCPLPEENPLKGTVVAEVNVNNSVIDLGTFSETVQKLVGDKLLFGGFEAFVIGVATIQLTGAHKGLKFGVA